MASTFFGLNIGKSGLFTYQTGLNTTAHNVANATTKGYTRQLIDQSATRAIRTYNHTGMAGTGVQVNSIYQVRDAYLDKKFMYNTSLQGEYANKSYYMTELQSYFNEITVTGFTKNFDNFSSALQSLVNDPSNKTTRTQVTQYGENLTEYLNSLSTNLTMIQEECNTEIKNQVDRINSIAEQICTLNSQINGVEINGTIANDLRDQRQVLIDELSTYVSVEVKEQTVREGSGVSTFEVKINGQILVDSYDYNKLKLVPREKLANQNDMPGMYDVVWQNDTAFNALGEDVSGSLKAIIQMRDGNKEESLSGKVTAAQGTKQVTLTSASIQDVAKLNIPESGYITIDNRRYQYESFILTQGADGKYQYTFQLTEGLKEAVNNKEVYIGNQVDYKGVPYYMAQLNEFVRTYTHKYNEICQQGVGANGDPGVSFFSSTNKAGVEVKFGADYLEYYKLTCGTVSINSDVKNNLDKVVTSSDVVNGVENSDIAKKLLALQSDRTMFKQGAPVSFFQTMVAEIGVLAKTAMTLEGNQDDIIADVTKQRLSVSGVDLDEEAMNLTKYQQAYRLNSKVISVMDEVLDRLINYTGV